MLVRERADIQRNNQAVNSRRVFACAIITLGFAFSMSMIPSQASAAEKAKIPEGKLTVVEQPKSTTQEAPKQESPKQETAKQESPKQEAATQEAPKQEAPKPESASTSEGSSKETPSAPVEKQAAPEPPKASDPPKEADTSAPAASTEPAAKTAEVEAPVANSPPAAEEPKQSATPSAEPSEPAKASTAPAEEPKASATSTEAASSATEQTTDSAATVSSEEASQASSESGVSGNDEASIPSLEEGNLGQDKSDSITSNDTINNSNGYQITNDVIIDASTNPQAMQQDASKLDSNVNSSVETGINGHELAIETEQTPASNATLEVAIGGQNQTVPSVAEITKLSSASISTSASSISVTFIAGGLIAYEDANGDMRLKYDDIVSGISSYELFSDNDIDGDNYTDDVAMNFVRLWGLTPGTDDTTLVQGKSFGTVTVVFNDPDGQFMPSLNRMGYIPAGLYAIGYHSSDFSRLDASDLANGGSLVSEYFQSITGASLPASITLICVWQVDDSWYLKGNLNYNSSDGTDLLNEEIGWDDLVYLPDVTQDATYGYTGSYGEYEFAGYTIDTDEFRTKNTTLKIYTVNDNMPYVKPDSSGIRFSELYYRLVGAYDEANGSTPYAFPANRYFDDNTTVLPSSLYRDEDPVFGQDLIIRAVFKKRAVEQLSFSVQYYNTNADNSGEIAVGSVTHKSKTANTATLSSLGISAPIATPPYAGYDVKFDGWATSPGGTVVISSDGGAMRDGLWGSGTPANNGSYSLYAVWAKTKQGFIVQYYPNGASTTSGGAAVAIEDSTTFNIPDHANASPGTTGRSEWTYANHQFVGWATSSTSSNADASGMTYDAIGLAQNSRALEKNDVVKLYAVWQALTYSVTFKLGAGDKWSNNPTTGDRQATYAQGTTNLSASMPIPQKTGYTFIGWTEGNNTNTVVVDSGGTAISSFVTTAGATHTLTAKFSEKTYTINWYERWDTTGGKSPYVATSSIAFSSGASTSLKNMTKNWDAGHTLPAAGEGSTADSQVPAQVKVTSGANTMTYRFLGWYVVKNGGSWTSSDGVTALGDLTLSGVLNTPNATVGDTSVTVYGIWQSLNLSVTYYTNTTKDWNGTQWVSWNASQNMQISPADPVAKDMSYTVNDHTTSFTGGTVLDGHTFIGWSTTPNPTNGNIATYVNGDSITIGNSSIQLYAQWRRNTVTVALNANAGSETPTLNAKSNLTFTWGETLNESSLTTSTPVRANYEFKGWAESANGSVIVGPTDAGATSVVNGTWADQATDAGGTSTATKTLYAIWDELKYTVIYNANLGTDSANTVSFTKTQGGAAVASPYAFYSNSALVSTRNLVSGVDITAKRVDGSGNEWYIFEGWSTTDGDYYSWNSGTNLRTVRQTSITDADTVGPVNGVGGLLTGTALTNRILNLYAMWRPVEFTVTYSADGGNGTVAPITEKVYLSTGLHYDGTAIQGSTATATATGYTLAKPTWTYNGSAPQDSNYTGGTSAVQAQYSPSLSYLRALRNATPAVDGVEFIAHFVAGTYDYQVQLFWEKADGTYSTSADWSGSVISGQNLKASFGQNITYQTEITTGTELWELPLGLTYQGSVLNRSLFELDTSRGGNLSFTTAAETTASGFTNNVIKLYYKRLTYDLSAVFQTKDQSGHVSNGKPSSADGVNSSATYYLPGSAVNTALRWGQDVTVGIPSTPGYSFAWNLTTPTPDGGNPSLVPTSASPNFNLSYADMAQLTASVGGSPAAMLTGLFEVITYTITLKDTGSNAPHNSCWSSSSVSGLNSSPYEISATVASDGAIPSGWALNPTDSDQNYFFAGWTLDGDTTGAIISSEDLKNITSWSGNATYISVWKQKVVITYLPGDPDSFGNSKADWGAMPTGGWTTSIGGTGLSEVYLANSAGAFGVVVNALDPVTHNPKATDGWKFAYWTLSGASGQQPIGHSSVYVGQNADPRYLDGTASPAFQLDNSYTFVAHWEPVTQTVTINQYGPVINNSVNPKTVSDGDSTGVKMPLAQSVQTYKTDDEVNLALYVNVNGTDAGYTIAGWNWKFTDANGAVTTGTYTDKNQKFHVKSGTSTELTPIFNENTFTFTYSVASDATGKGAIDPTTTDSVFAVMHNGINVHTATTSNATAYQFDKWTLDGSTVSTDGALTALVMGLQDSSGNPTGGVITANRAYIANFSTKQYKLTFETKATDGSTVFDGLDGRANSSVSVSGSNVDQMSGNVVTASWGATIAPAIVGVSAPEGYKLGGWIINGGMPQGTSNPETFFDTYAVTGDATVTAYMKIDEAKNYTVNYNYDPKGTTQGSFTPTAGETARAVAWADDVRPEKSANQTPTTAGYTFDGWYLYNESTGQWGPQVFSVSSSYTFSTIYNHLQANGYTAPTVDTGSKSITIYGKWTARSYTVTIDVYGNIANDTSTDSDNVTVVSGNIDPRSVYWHTLASGFAPGASALVRPGYNLVGWSADVTATTTGATTVLSSKINSSATGGDTYGSIAKSSGITSIALHAIWEGQTYTVLYKFNDASFGSPPGTAPQTNDWTQQHGWVDEVQYYKEGLDHWKATNAWPRSGYTFNGWDVQYLGWNTATSSLGVLNGTRLTNENSSTTIRDMRNGDTTIPSGDHDIARMGNDYIVVLTASWTADGYYVFQDVLVSAAGVQVNGDATTAMSAKGGTKVSIADYGTPKTNINGYDYDGTATAGSFGADGTVVIVEGLPTTIKVYYKERTYRIDFYKDENNTMGTADWYTTDNAYTTAVPTTPVDIPTKPGYSFDGWLLTDGATTIALDGINKVSDLFATAPASGSVLRAVPSWAPIQATIAWQLGTNGDKGDISPAANSWTGNATSTTGPAAIAATVTDRDYVFDKWTYSYSDGDGTHTGEVSASSPFATLSGDGATLTPTVWTDGMWHDITFTANFALSDALQATIKYYLENGNNLTTYIEQTGDEAHDRSAIHGEIYTVGGSYLKTYAGYTLNEDKSDLSHTYEYGIPSTYVYTVYYTANQHHLAYKYVIDATGAIQTDVPVGAAAASSFNPSAGYATVYTGQTVVLATTPNAPSGYQFNGWYEGTATGYGTTITSLTVPATDMVDIDVWGTWANVEHSVQFISQNAGLTVSQASGGYKVNEGALVKTAVSPDAATLTDLGVSFNNNGQPYTVTGWKVLLGGVEQSGVELGESQVLAYTVPNADVTFVAVWSPTYAVSYDPGLHGAFTKLTHDNINIHDPNQSVLDMDDATKHGFSGTPSSNDGWTFAGWGRETTNGTWEYYFTHNAYVDYGQAVSSYTEANKPTTIADNYNFVAFFQALDRTLVFANTNPDGSAFTPAVTYDSSFDTSWDVKTAQSVSLPTSSDNIVTREGFTLSGWTDGTNHYTTTYTIPDTSASTLKLYPEFTFNEIRISYEVDGGSTGRGVVDNPGDTQSSAGSNTINGSTATARPGYVFEKWTYTDADNNTSDVTASSTSIAALTPNPDGSMKITPKVSGTFKAVFNEKTYDITRIDDGVADVTLPTPVATTGATWTTDVALGEATRAGYIFAGWDVYADDGTGAKTGTAIRTGLTGTKAVSAISDGPGATTKLVLVATWNPIAYQVFYNDGKTSGTGAVSGMPADRSTANNSAVEFTTDDISGAAPTRTGYTFAGWDINDDGAADIDDADVLAGTKSLTYSGLVSGDDTVYSVTLKALWAPDQHSITYSKGDDGAWSANAGDYPADDPAYGDSDPATKAAEPISIATTKTDATYALRSAATLVRPGWKVNAWSYSYTDSDGVHTGQITPGDTWTMPNADVTLAPIWAESGDYNVRFSQGTESGNPVTDAVIPSARENITYATNDIDASTHTRPGYTFNGWIVTKTADNSTIQTLAATDTLTNLVYSNLALSDDVKDITLVATWSKNNNYEVTFEGGLPTGSSETVSGLPGNVSGLEWGSPVATLAGSPATAPTRSGYVFNGWNVYTDAAHANQVNTVASTTAEAVYSAIANDRDVSALYLVAQWTRFGNYVVTFDANAGGDAVSRMPVNAGNLAWDDDVATQGSEDGAAGIPVRAGYTFLGWTIYDANNAVVNGTDQAGSYYTGDHASYAALANNIDTASLKLSANWNKKNDYTVKFSANVGLTGDVVANMPYASEAIPFTKTGLEWDSEVTTLVGSAESDKPSRTGYTFLGWTVFSSDATTQIGVDARVTDASAVYSDLAVNDTDANTTIWLVAEWQAKPFNLTYDISVAAGESIASWTSAITSLVADPSAPESHYYRDSVILRAKSTVKRSGYSLRGWAHGADEYEFDTNGVATLPMPAADITLIALWEPTVYTVTFMTGDGDGGRHTVDVATMPYYSSASSMKWSGNYDASLSYNRPTREGYDFQGWIVTVDGDGSPAQTRVGVGNDGTGSGTYESIAGNPDITDLIMTASWQPQNLGLTYVIGTQTGAVWVAANITDGGASNPTLAVGHDADSTFELRRADTGKLVGWSLKGWKDSNTSGVTPTEYRFDEFGKVEFTMPATNQVLYAIWERTNDYMVSTYNNLPAASDVAIGAKIAAYPAAADVADYTKGGLEWDGAAGLTGVEYPTASGWEFRGWTVYDMNKNVVSIKNSSATYVNTLDSPILINNPVFNVLAGNEDLAERRELTLVANWRMLTYTVVFADGVDAEAGDTPINGSLPANYEGAFSGTVTHTAPTRIGYTFAGWAVTDVTDGNNVQTIPWPTEAGESQTVYSTLAGNNAARRALVLTATWNEKQGYNVTFVGKEDSGQTDADLSGFTNYTNIYWDDTVDVYSSIEGADGKPTRTGYTFGAERTVNNEKVLAGWVVRNTTDAENPVNIGYIYVSNIGRFHYARLAIDPATGIADDQITNITLTALWTAIPHTVTYMLGEAGAEWIASAIDASDPGKSNPAAAMNYATDDVVRPLRNASTAKRAGYSLAAWDWTATDANGVNTTGRYNLFGEDAVTSFVMPDADVVLAAVWTPKTYTVTFEAGKPAKATDSLQTVINVPDNLVDVVKWDEDIDVQVKIDGSYAEPKLAGWKFDGWLIEYAEETGANTSALMGTTYKFSELALTDTGEHAALNLIAKWIELPYRLIYVDPIDENGAALATPNVISNTADTYWNDTVSIADPWTVVTPAYGDKTDEDWRFDGWQVLNATTGEYMLLDSETEYSVLAKMEDLNVGDVAIDGSDNPALTLYATWTRRVPFVVEFVKLPVAAGLTSDADTEVVESTRTVKGLDGESIADVWATTVLGYGAEHHINGYEYDREASEPGMVGTLVAGGDTLHLKLKYNQILDYVIIYDATPGKNGSNATMSSKRTPAWDTPSVYFEPTDANWSYTGHKIDHWAYGPTGTENVFEASEELTFADIAKAIYGTVDGSQGIATDGMVTKPVTLHAVWVERSDYKVKYDNNYSHLDGYKQDGVEVKVDEKFLERVSEATFTPDELSDVVWSSTDLIPSESAVDQITEPGVKDGMALYAIEGWNYSTDGGTTQFKADGKKFSDIVAAINADGSDLESAEITLYARWKEIGIKLTYASVIATVDENGNVTIGSGTAGGTVSRTSEIVAAVTGGKLSGTKLVAEGATAIANPGYHFYGWRRASDQEIVYAPGMNPSVLSTSAVASLFTQASATGFNVLPDGSIDGSTLFAVAQNSDDGYWHSEEYQALFVQNDMATLHYDKNGSDATGSIADAEAPFGSLLTLSNGSGFSRTYWTLTGWNTQADGKGTPYALSQAAWPLPEGETTLYAMWKKNNATLTYEANGDDVSGLPQSVTDEWGTPTTVASDTPTRKHYTFKGWNTSSDGTGTAYEAGSELDLPGSGVKLYAQWELNKYIASVSTGGTGAKGTVISSGDDYPEIEHGGHLPKGYYIAEPEDGYHLTGWKYTMVDEDGNVTTGVVDDPSDLAIIGEVSFEPIFEADAKPKTSEETKKTKKTEKTDNPDKPSTNPPSSTDKKKAKKQNRSNTGTRAMSAPAAAQGNYLAKTGDSFTLVALALVALLIASLALVLIARRRSARSTHNR